MVNLEDLKKSIDDLKDANIEKFLLIAFSRNDGMVNIMTEGFNCDRHDHLAIPTLLLADNFKVDINYLSREIENSVKKYHLGGLGEKRDANKEVISENNAD